MIWTSGKCCQPNVNSWFPSVLLNRKKASSARVVPKQYPPSCLLHPTSKGDFTVDSILFKIPRVSISEFNLDGWCADESYSTVYEWSGEVKDELWDATKSSFVSHLLLALNFPVNTPSPVFVVTIKDSIIANPQNYFVDLVLESFPIVLKQVMYPLKNETTTTDDDNGDDDETTTAVIGVSQIFAFDDFSPQLLVDLDAISREYCTVALDCSHNSFRLDWTLELCNSSINNNKVFNEHPLGSCEMHFLSILMSSALLLQQPSSSYHDIDVDDNNVEEERVVEEYLDFTAVEASTTTTTATTAAIPSNAANILKQWHELIDSFAVQTHLPWLEENIQADNNSNSNSNNSFLPCSHLAALNAWSLQHQNVILQYQHNNNNDNEEEDEGVDIVVVVAETVLFEQLLEFSPVCQYMVMTKPTQQQQQHQQQQQIGVSFLIPQLLFKISSPLDCLDEEENNNNKSDNIIDECFAFTNNNSNNKRKSLSSSLSTFLSLSFLAVATEVITVIPTTSTTIPEMTPTTTTATIASKKLVVADVVPVVRASVVVESASTFCQDTFQLDSVVDSYLRLTNPQHHHHHHQQQQQQQQQEPPARSSNIQSNNNNGNVNNSNKVSSLKPPLVTNSVLHRCSLLVNEHLLAAWPKVVALLSVVVARVVDVPVTDNNNVISIAINENICVCLFSSVEFNLMSQQQQQQQQQQEEEEGEIQGLSAIMELREKWKTIVVVVVVAAPCLECDYTALNQAIQQQQEQQQQELEQQQFTIFECDNLPAVLDIVVLLLNEDVKRFTLQHQCLQQEYVQQQEWLGDLFRISNNHDQQQQQQQQQIVLNARFLQQFPGINMMQALKLLSRFALSDINSNNINNILRFLPSLNRDCLVNTVHYLEFHFPAIFNSATANN